MPNRPASAWLPREFSFWPEDDKVRTPYEVQQMYELGHAGAWLDPAGTEEFEGFIRAQSFGELDGGRIAHDAGFADSAVGKLVIPFVFTEKLLPGCYPGAAQQRGDCVSHSTKNAALTTMICDIVSAKPDEVSGRVEGLPDFDPEGIKQGALSTEIYYWYRGYSGDGWSCDVAAKVACDKAGLWPRKNYSELGIDLTRYSGSLAGKYGRSAPPSEITSHGQKHLIRTATRVSGFEQIRDFLNNGYGITSCGGEGWSSSRDENGFSKRQGSWSHALSYIGADDRDIIKQKYGEPLILVLNSWGRWNTGGRKILGTDIQIPEGSYWALASACSRRSAYAFSGVDGWPAKSLPPFTSVVG
jgi:hypothetical protein